jgi:hypothetical protein
MLILNVIREDILKLLNRETVCAEIGVAEGYFSRKILENEQPKKLHLIDPWEFQKRDDYSKDVNNVDNNVNQIRYNSIQMMFQDNVAKGQVTIHRDFSQNVVHQFEDNYFDWVYIDGLHSYEGVMQDLENFDKKVKEDGMIIGHDYANNFQSREMEFGVIPAVNDFVKKKGYCIAFITAEPFPTYVIFKTKHWEESKHKNFVSSLLYHTRMAVEIDDISGFNLEQDVMQISLKDGSKNVVSIQRFTKIT